MADVRVVFEGWGRGPWGFGPWGEGSYDFVLTTSLGEETVSTDTRFSVTGVQGTTTLGTVTTKTVNYVYPTGVAGTTALGTVTVTHEANVSVTGVAAEAIIPTGGGPAFTADGTAQLSTAQAKFGPSSLLLDGTDDFVTSDTNIDLSSGDFTVDMWIRPTNVTGYKGLWQTGTSSLLNVYLIGNQVQGVVGGSTTLFLSSTRISPNVWTMISVEREGNVHRLYINGVLEQSSSTGNRPDDGVFAIGKNGFGDFNGYIDELRLSSVARYGGTSFTEPTANYAVDGDTNSLLHFDGINGSTDIINETDRGVIVIGEANVFPTGLEATSEVGNPTVKTDAILSVTGVEATTALGIPSVSTEVNASVTGVAGTTGIGVVSIITTVNLYPIGVQATGRVGDVSVWGLIIPSQTANWAEIDPNQTSNWTDINPSQTANWTDIAA